MDSKSIAIANEPGYLDKLLEVYPVTQETRREIPKKIKKELEQLFASQDDYTFIEKLLKVTEIPYQGPLCRLFTQTHQIFGVQSSDCT